METKGREAGQKTGAPVPGREGERKPELECWLGLDRRSARNSEWKRAVGRTWQ